MARTTAVRTTPPPDVGTDTVSIGGTPGSPNVGKAPTAGQTRVLRSDPRTEYLAGTQLGASWYLNLARSLPPFIDDLQDSAGTDVYRRMLTDPQVAASINVFKAGCLENGPSFSPAIDNADDPDYEKAQFVADWCSAIISDLGTDLDVVLWNMMDACHQGHKVAELVFEYSDQYWNLPARKVTAAPGSPPTKAAVPVGPPKGSGGPQLILKNIKVKPNESVGFLVDAYMNVIGLLGHIPGDYYPIMPGMVYASIDQIPNLLPLEHFSVLSFRPVDGNPLGTSLLRPAYSAWYLKEQLWAEYGKFLSQMAGGMLVGKPDPNAVPLSIQNTDGSAEGDTATPEEALLQTLLRAKNGAVLVVQPGADVALHYPVANGDAFLEAFQLLNLEMTKGILHVTLATEEGKHQARAAAEVHADVLSILVRQAKHAVERMLRDVLRRLITYNYGDDAIRLTPLVSLGGDLESADRSKLWTAVGALMMAGYFSPDQMPAVDDMIGMPVRIGIAPDQDSPAGDTAQTPGGSPPPGTAPPAHTSGVRGAAAQGKGPAGVGRGPNAPADDLHPEEEGQRPTTTQPPRKRAG